MDTTIKLFEKLTEIAKEWRNFTRDYHNGRQTKKGQCLAVRNCLKTRRVLWIGLRTSAVSF